MGISKIKPLTNQYNSVGGSRGRGLLCLAPQLVQWFAWARISDHCTIYLAWNLLVFGVDLYIYCLTRILPSSTQANTLPGTDSRVMPRQLLQSDKSPFLPFFHCVETSLLCHTVLNSFVRCGMTVSAFSADLAECDPYLLLCHSWAYWLLVLLLFQLLLPYSSEAPVCPASFSYSCSTGSGQFSTAAKCSCHLFICCSCVAACLPSLSLIDGRFTCSPASSLTVWYSVFLRLPASPIVYLEIKFFAKHCWLNITSIGNIL